MKLRPNKTTQKILISTTSRLFGEFENSMLLIAHAWPDFYSRAALARNSEGPASRNAFVVVFETAVPETGSPLLNYVSMGELICSYLSVLFGKRFDSHGLTESNGIFHLPNLNEYAFFCDDRLPQNSHVPRLDIPIPLNLTEISRIERLFTDVSLDSKFLRIFQTASKFYLQAMQHAESNPEVAYLHLITTGEILSGFYEYDKDLLLDDDSRKALAKIRDGLVDGEKLARFIENKLLFVKKRFITTIMTLVDSEFFQRSEARETFAGFNIDSFRSSISAAYDLRSKYVHTGMPFGGWIAMNMGGGMNNEVQVGQPVVDDVEFGKILAKAPTYIGLERVMRYCLLKFAKANGAYVEPHVTHV